MFYGKEGKEEKVKLRDFLRFPALSRSVKYLISNFVIRGLRTQVKVQKIKKCIY